MREISWRTRPQHRKLRIAVLLTAAWCSLLRGIAYLPSTDGNPIYLTYVDWWLPMHAWAVLWITGGIALAGAPVYPRLAVPAMSVFVGMTTLWSVSYLMSWIFLDSPSSWLTGSTLAGMAVFAAILTALIERRVPSPEGTE
ncbi:hypothetical protein IM25_21285 [Rhodococcus sp. p52]|uniref:hypothetical protein n=1 Tax=Rhodococcus sp. p52 TaxID=935199 RepID=UPI00082619BF|nr:hypothetical protein [Rhodococcus sp. p52]AOD23801.1 hypothetical protein IM25_21285 [Rhodococcus sp. p52]